MSKKCFLVMKKRKREIGGRREAKWATALSWLTISGMTLAEYLGVYTTELSHKTLFSSVVVVASVHLVIAFTARRVARGFHEGIKRAEVQETTYQHIF